MLEDSLVESRKKKVRNPVTAVVSVVAHVVTVGVLVLIPLLKIEALTIPPIDMSMWLPHVETPRPIAVFSAQPRAQNHTQPDPNAFTSPAIIPEKIAYVDEPPSSIPGLTPSIGTGGDGTALINLIGRGQPDVAPPSQPPAPQPQSSPAPSVTKVEVVRRSGGVQAANLIYQVKPVYPQIAIRTRVQGTVVLDAVITKEGTIDSLQVVSGHPLLTQAALDAVKQWKYRPTLLSGDPVSVITTITVTFTLQ
jgi:protein TonB